MSLTKLYQYFRKQCADKNLFGLPKFFKKSTFDELIPDDEINVKKLMTYEKIFSLPPCNYSLSRYINGAILFPHYFTYLLMFKYMIINLDDLTNLL